MAERVGNWTDADHVAMPQCPGCGAVNRPGVVYVERIPGVAGGYYCTVCSHRWLPTEP